MGLANTCLPIKELVQRHGYMSHNFDNDIYHREGLFSWVKIYYKRWVEH
jgi:hypothetical protein